MPFHCRTEKELLRLASEGNKTAFEAIFNRYKDKLYHYTFSLNRSKEVTEDIIQDTFLKLWKDKERLASIEHFSSYLFLMTRNQSINALKRFAKETLILSRLNQQETAAAVSNPQTILEHKQTRELLEDSLQRLPPQQKLLYTLSRENDLKHHEIAAQLNISPSTVKNHIVQAMRTLKEKMRFHPGIASAIMFSEFLF
jgi:RNA polymerase sigma-70 factor (ECF subfamily)